jgi:hypothetical protein
MGRSPAPRQPHDPDQSHRSAAANDAGMAFDRRQVLEAAGIATIILSAATIVGVLYSIWE